MTFNLSFSYCLLQYRHNPWLKERINIGVLLYSKENQFFKLKVRGWEGRVLAAYPDLTRPNFTEDLKQIRRAVEKFASQGIVQDSLFYEDQSPFQSGAKVVTAEQLAEFVAPSMDASYQWTKGGVGLCSDPQQQLEKLFDRFVSAFDGEKKDSGRSNSQVWSDAGKMLAERKLERHMDMEPTIQTGLGAIKWQAGYQNGAYNVINSLSFDLADEGHIGAKAARWGGFAQAVANNPSRRAQTKLLIGRPSIQRLESAFESAADHLRGLIGEENLFYENDAKALVDQISDDIVRHS